MSSIENRRKFLFCEIFAASRCIQGAFGVKPPIFFWKTNTNIKQNGRKPFPKNHPGYTPKLRSLNPKLYLGQWSDLITIQFQRTLD